MKYSPDYCSRFRILKGGKISLVVSALIVSMSLLQAAPSGGVVTAGNASIAQNGSVTTITQSTQKAAINWQNFSIAQSETVNFKQPNASSVTLNRVVGNEKSVIDGALNANGQVFILNSNGVLFSKNARINTAGLVATTMNLSDTDFMNGNYAFKGDSQASILHQGTINISDAGYVALLGKEVKNEGFIKATLGKVELVGAKEVTLNLNGNSLVNLKVGKGVLDALVENKGAIYADGGKVYLTTNAVNELLRGAVNNTGIIEANSIDDVTGKIELFAHGGTTNVSGTLEAKDGFIETSGNTLHVEDSTIIKTKKWLLDPTDIIIESSGGAVGGASVSATAIQNALSTADIELQATNDITVNENITWATAKMLTLTAGDEIYVNATIKNTNTTNGGVYFHAANTHNKVIFGTNGLVSIYNVYQLQWMNQAVQGKYVLGGNIDASGTSSWNSGAGFVPIGGNPPAIFTGTFDGQGHTISDLYINRPSMTLVGLFGYSYVATIRNIGLLNVNITGQDLTGGLAGMFNNGTITNAYVTGRVRGNGTMNVVGGLAGGIENSTITSSYATVDVTSSSNYVGGLVGAAYDTSLITNSYATGSVTGATSVGGLVGILNGRSSITNSYATGSVTGTTFAGGLLGSFSSAGAVTNSYWNTQTSGKTNSAGLAVGKTTEEMMNSSMYTGWSILGDTTLAKNYPTLRMASSGAVWVMGAKSTSTPDPTPNITPIINGTAITPHVIPNFTPPTPPVQAPQQFSVGGQMVQLVSIPSTDVASQLVGTQEARAMIQGGEVGELRIPLGQNSGIQLVNGGVHLPEGLEQQFFMAQR